MKKRKIFFRGGEAVVEPWEDELLWDDDFSEEEKDAEEQIEKTSEAGKAFSKQRWKSPHALTRIACLS